MASRAQRRQRQLESRYDSKAERNLAYVLGEIQRIGSALELPDVVVDRACQLAREIQSEALFEGDDLDAGAAGAIYTACRCCEIVRSPANIATVARTDPESVRRMYRKAQITLELETPLVTPTDWIPQFAAALEVPTTVRQAAMRWGQRAEANEMAFVGCAPSGIAAACVALGSKETITQERLATIADISPTTIRKRVRDLKALPEDGSSD